MGELLRSGGLPVWAEILLVFGTALFASGLSWAVCVWYNHPRNYAQLAEEIEHVLDRRRNDLADRGRRTERRPEHDDQTPSRMGRVRFGPRRTPGDQGR